MPKDSTVNDLLYTFFSTFQRLGFKATIKVLKDAQRNNVCAKVDEFEKYILQCICIEFATTEYRLFDTQKRGTRTDAVSIYCYFLKKYLNYTIYDIADKIKRKASTVSRHITFIDELDSNVKQDNILIGKILSIDTCISGFQKENLTLNKKIE
jgi:hypothetical protein